MIEHLDGWTMMLVFGGLWLLAALLMAVAVWLFWPDIIDEDEEERRDSWTIR